MTLMLSSQRPFAQGGNRLCFVHPKHPDRCVKVRRPDFSLEARRRKKGFPKNLKPLSSFDDNLEEFHVMQQLEQQFGMPIFNLISRCYGFEDTDMGRGLTSELIRDHSGHISHTLKQYLWDHDHTEDSQHAVNTFCNQWIDLGVPSRDLLLHNIVAQRNHKGLIVRLVLIDGLGNQNILPMWLQPLTLRRNKARRKTENLRERIEALVNQRGADTFPGFHGQLFHEGVEDKDHEQ
ncbi:YrbL family protein [Ketobacter alkanivorans]|uniref:Uncharacterized protein n=1 Tax=Ketobacter alkanivorans TaxID=1917421 RepID=A0A2K9LRJ6_9GAMM|nr:YrbL family protein [Ketobacter alkanivorans]AUM13444.1 hypothetical protein Kalk_13885 [Ketobacter alkanivorans]